MIILKKGQFVSMKMKIFNFKRGILWWHRSKLSVFLTSIHIGGSVHFGRWGMYRIPVRSIYKRFRCNGYHKNTLYGREVDWSPWSTVNSDLILKEAFWWWEFLLDAVLLSCWLVLFGKTVGRRIYISNQFVFEPHLARNSTLKNTLDLLAKCLQKLL